MASKDTKPTGKDPLRDLLDEKSLADEITNAIAGNDCPGDKELFAYIRKELQDAERVEIKSHLIFCSRCKDREKNFQKDLAFKVDETKLQTDGKRHKSFRKFKLTPLAKQRSFALTVTLAATAALAVGIGSYLILLWSGTSVSFGGRFVHAQGRDLQLHKSQPFLFEVRTPQAHLPDPDRHRRRRPDRLRHPRWQGRRPVQRQGRHPDHAGCHGRLRPLSSSPARPAKASQTGSSTISCSS